MRLGITRFVLGGAMATLGLVSTGTTASAAPILLHSYNLNIGSYGVPAGVGATQYADQTCVGGCEAMDTNGGSAGATGYTYGAGQGLSVQNALGVAGVWAGNYTLEIDFSLNDPNEQTTWQRLVEFKNLTGDFGVYSNPFDNDPDAVLVGTGATAYELGSTVLTNNTPNKLWVTRANNGIVGVALGGTTLGGYGSATEQFQIYDAVNQDYVFSLFNNIINLFQDNTTGGFEGENGAGFVDNVRIYADSELDPIPEPASLVLLGTGLVVVARGIRKRQKKA